MRPLAFALVFVSMVPSLGGCAAYTSAMNGALGNMKAVSGSFKVVNTMSVPVCQVSLFHAGAPDRSDNDLNGKSLAPGGEARVDVPYVGKPGDPSSEKQPDTFGMRVYACKTEAFDTKPGALLATISTVNVRGSEAVAIR